MKSKKWIFLLLIAVTILLGGCSMRTIDQMYCLPKRSEGYLNLQSAVDSAMSGLEYHAPISGDHRQPVQLVDLNGDGADECLVFAKGSGEKPLKILVFTQTDGQYVHTETLENYGTAYDQVQYVHFGNQKGYDIVLGRQLSDQLVRPLSVYTMSENKMTQLLTTQYTYFSTPDLNDDGVAELLILRPGDNPASNGVAEVYSLQDGIVERSREVSMSEPVDQVKRIVANRLGDGPAAVYVASDVGGSAIVTDVFALLDGVFTNVSLSNNSGTGVQTLRNYYVYADDIDRDGILEMPALIPASASGEGTVDQHLILWYTMNSDGSKTDKLCTYHSFSGGWYLELPLVLTHSLTVTQYGNSYEFSALNADAAPVKLLTIYAFTGTEREELANTDNRFVLYRTETTVYACNLEVASAAYDMSRDTMVNAFRMITLSTQTPEL